MKSPGAHMLNRLTVSALLKIVILVVGTKDEILKGHPDHPIKLESLGGGRLVDHPLRDPLTMKPVAK